MGHGRAGPLGTPEKGSGVPSKGVAGQRQLRKWHQEASEELTALDDPSSSSSGSVFSG